MKFKNRLLPCLWALSLFFTPMAHAFDVSVLGAATVSNFSFDNPPSAGSSAVGFGGGGLVGFNLNPVISLETGLLFLDHAYSFTPTTTTHFNYVDAPLMLRFSPISLISVSGGVYYGSPVNVGTNTDYGLIAGIGARLPLLLFKLRFDVLYEYGLANVGPSTDARRSRNLDFLAGVMLDLW